MAFEPNVVEDTGCEYAASCLACPHPVCKEDDARYFVRLRMQGRSNRVMEMVSSGLSEQEVGRRMKLSRRTIGRILKKAQV